MFVRVVELVNGPDGKIPSLIRPYVIYDKVKEFGSKRVYFSPLHRSFKIIDGIAHGELSRAINDGRGYPLKGLDPSVIEGASQIVNGIASNECDLSNRTCIRRIVLDDFMSSMRIDLNSRGAAIWQTAKAIFKVSDVLIGPFDFESSVPK